MIAQSTFRLGRNSDQQLGQERVGSLFWATTYDRQIPKAEKDSRPRHLSIDVTSLNRIGVRLKLPEILHCQPCMRFQASPSSQRTSESEPPDGRMAWTCQRATLAYGRRVSVQLQT